MIHQDDKNHRSIARLTILPFTPVLYFLHALFLVFPFASAPDDVSSFPVLPFCQTYWQIRREIWRKKADRNYDNLQTKPEMKSSKKLKFTRSREGNENYYSDFRWK